MLFAHHSHHIEKSTFLVSNSTGSCPSIRAAGSDRRDQNVYSNPLPLVPSISITNVPDGAGTSRTSLAVTFSLGPIPPEGNMSESSMQL